MSNLSLELSLLHSPYFDKLLSEMKYILHQKRKLLFGIKNYSDFQNKLSFVEKGLYESILKREKELLLEMIQIKDLSNTENNTSNGERDNLNDYDIYDSNTYGSFS